MRLKSIKLAGFKSFVDPTTVNFPSNLAGVVGPNGCGKSNVIDAVRWVMGESSAKQLRGDSMTDVIFSGSGGRKPVQQASIELVFDNSSGRITGEYASYNDISVCRKVTRDGSSDYFLNGSKCRRRDITDIFLGTGLGPRSYSIIEQGMISSLITARPEDLRVYIEEAAGISKYKERRRDTENRIRRTRENLERLTDLREELQRQLQRLKRQSEAAKKYRELKAQERTTQSELQALRWRKLDQQIDEKNTRIKALEVDMERVTAQELNCVAEIEKQRQQRTERSDELNTRQAAYYEIGAEISRLEQQIQYQEERQRQLDRDLTQTRTSVEQAQQHLAEDTAKRTGWQAEIDELERQRETQATLVKDVEMRLKSSERSRSEADSHWEAFQKQASETKNKTDIEQSKIKHFEQSMKEVAARRDRLQAQLQEDDRASGLLEEMEALESESVMVTADLEQAIATEESLYGDVQAYRERQTKESSQLDKTRSELQSKRGRLASLEALQEAALSEGQSAIEQWLTRQDLGQANRLADEMQVVEGWEMAVETVLDGQLRAIRINSIEAYARQLADLSEGVLELIEDSASSPGEWGGVGAQSLADFCLNTEGKALLKDVVVAPDLDQALGLRAHLQDHQSVVTPDGLWLGKHWARVRRSALDGVGILERKAEIETLVDQISEQESAERQQADAIIETRNKLQLLEEQQRDTARKKDTLNRQLSDKRSKISALKAKHEQILAQLKRNQAELERANQQYETEQSQLGEARRRLADGLDAMEADSGKRDQLHQARESARAELQKLREQFRQESTREQQLQMREQLVRTQFNSLEESMERLRQQLSNLKTRQDDLQKNALQADDQPDLKGNLDKKLRTRLESEALLTEARKALQEVENQIRTIEQQRVAHQNELEKLRGRYQDERLVQQDLKTRKETVLEQLDGQDPEAIIEQLPADAAESHWQAQLEQLQTKISRLGAINLAAIDEYETEGERKRYLDEQDAELVDALTTLEAAIKKIDKETRTRFKETFDKIDQGFKALFPRLFGGGHAYLQLTGDDLLETGVAIMARPPGKRNSTIHLLSGGEKAMTAIALVFAIFQLNPAPFCMLDEVDAPLDDANVGRFAAMVKEMSATVQMIFITHNKITMEMADQLMGVTMHEPGVSRLVSVDVDSALRMAAA